ncbi:MAG: hypothetical protein RL173_2365, partial [Fibrobacterota bacterium]
MGDFVLGLFLSVDGAFRFGWILERGAFTSVKNEFDGLRSIPAMRRAEFCQQVLFFFRPAKPIPYGPRERVYPPMNGPRASNPTTAAAAAPTKKGSDSAAAAGQSSSGGKSQYQQDTERDNPEPAAASNKGSVTLSNCQFLTAADKLILNE